MNGMDGESIVVPGVAGEQNGSGSKSETGVELEDTDIASNGEKEVFGGELNERPSWFDDI